MTEHNDEYGPTPLVIDVKARVTIPTDEVNNIGAALLARPLGSVMNDVGVAVRHDLVAVLDELDCGNADVLVEISLAGGVATERRPVEPAPDPS